MACAAGPGRASSPELLLSIVSGWRQKNDSPSSVFDRKKFGFVLMSAATSQRYVLTGATGALGYHFVRQVLAEDKNRSVSLLCRTKSSSFHRQEFQDLLATFGSRVEIIDSDLAEGRPTAATRDAVERAEGGVWHFAARTVLRTNIQDSDELTRAANYDGTMRLLDLVQAGATPKPFNHISTAYVAGKREGLVREDELDMGQEFRNSYEQSKFEAEREVATALRQGQPGIILRPSIVVEDSQATGAPKMTDIMAATIVTALKRREPLIMRYSEKAALNLVHMDWVLDSMRHLVANPAAQGGTFHLVSRKATRIADLLAAAAEAVPGFVYSFKPDIDPIELPNASRILDRAFTDIRPYFYAQIAFDRSRADALLPDHLSSRDFDSASVVNQRLTKVLADAADKAVV